MPDDACYSLSSFVSIDMILRRKKENSKADWNWRFLCIKYDRFLTDFSMQTKSFFICIDSIDSMAMDLFFAAIFAWASVSTKSSWGCFQGVPYYTPSCYVLNYFSLNYYLHLDIGMIFCSFISIVLRNMKLDFSQLKVMHCVQLGKKYKIAVSLAKNGFKKMLQMPIYWKCLLQINLCLGTSNDTFKRVKIELMATYAKVNIVPVLYTKL